MMQRELSDILTEIKQQGEELGVSSIYLHLLFWGISKTEGQAIYRQLRAEILKAVITGMTETMFGNQEECPSFKLNCNFFTEANVKLLEYVGCPKKLSRGWAGAGAAVVRFSRCESRSCILWGLEYGSSGFYDGFCREQRRGVDFRRGGRSL